MRQRSSDSSKSNSTVTTTPGNSQLDFRPPIMTPTTNPQMMRTPLAWQNRDRALDISRPQSSVHRRSMTGSHRTQQQIQAQKLSAAVIAQLNLKTANKHYNQKSSSIKPLHQRSSSSSSITKSLITKQQQLHKQLQQQQQFLRQQMLHRKANNLSNSSSPSVTDTSDDREEIPIVKHCRRSAASRASNNPSMISQLTRQHRQMVAIPQVAMLCNSNASNQDASSNAIHNLQTPSIYRNNATLRSTRSVPAIVYHQRQQLLQKQQQQMLYNQNANNFDNLDGQCPVHGNATPTTNHHNKNQIHSNQMLPIQLARPPLNIRKFASVNDLSTRTAAMNYLQTANSQLMPTIFTVANHHSLTPAMQASINQSISQSIKANQTLSNVIATSQAQINETPKMGMTNLLPLPMHPAIANHHTAQTIYTQPISIATSRPAPVLIPTFTTEPNSFAIAKHNKEQLINIIESNQDACCKGHLIVLWIILSVVIVGIVSGIVLGLTI